jgi:hypothetical protein
VVPTFIPVTTPAELTEAIIGKVLLHVPPVVVLARVVADPTQTVAMPVIAAGNGWTVATTVL